MLPADPRAASLKDNPQHARRHLRRIKIDTYLGMAFSNLVAFFIILTNAATLHAAGITAIETSAQAAEALRPLVGDLTFFLFSMGIVGTGMLAVPVLAGSAAYAMADSSDGSRASTGSSTRRRSSTRSSRSRRRAEPCSISRPWTRSGRCSGARS